MLVEDKLLILLVLFLYLRAFVRFFYPPAAVCLKHERRKVSKIAGVIK